MVAIAMVAVVVAMQWSMRAFASERGLYADEAAHFMNGLVLRDYLWEGLGQWPVDFAVDYYRHYPKIAPFMWPPLFHALLGVFLLPGWPPLPAAIVFVGLCTAWIGWRLYLTVCSFAAAPVALGAVALLLSSPVVVNLSSSVMIDILVAACALEAAFWLGRFAHTGATRDGAVFGTMAALACLAKGNGLSVVLAPVSLLLITGQLDLLKRPGLYVAAAIVAGLAAPPLYLAWGLDATLGDFGPPWPHIPARLALYSRFVWQELGSLPLVLAGVGAATALIIRPHWIPTSTRHHGAAFVALVLGGVGFHLLNPHIVSTGRYLTLVLAPILALMALGIVTITHGIHEDRHRRLVQGGALAALLALHLPHTPPLRAPAPLGYRDVIAALRTEPDGLAGQRLLIVSNVSGEGAGVTETAALHLTPRPMVLRSSKILAHNDWNNTRPDPIHPTPAALLDDLEALHVDYVILDEAPRARALPYWQPALTALTMDPTRVTLVRTFPAAPGRLEGPARSLRVYRVLRHSGAHPRPFDLTRTAPVLRGTRSQ